VHASRGASSIGFLTQAFLYANVDVNLTMKHNEAWDFDGYGDRGRVCFASAGIVADVTAVDPTTLPRNSTLENAITDAVDSLCVGELGPAGFSLSVAVRESIV